MSEATRHDAWQAGDSYEAYMGRWSRQVAPVAYAGGMLAALPYSTFSC